MSGRWSLPRSEGLEFEIGKNSPPRLVPLLLVFLLVFFIFSLLGGGLTGFNLSLLCMILHICRAKALFPCSFQLVFPRKLVLYTYSLGL